MRNLSKNLTSTLGIMLILFTFLLLINVLLPQQSDDFNHYYSALEGLKSAKSSYLYWNARVGELINVAFLAGINPYLFDLLNASVGVIFLLSFFWLIFCRLPRGFGDFATMSLVLFIIMFSCAFGSVFAWGAGSLNYLWGLCFILLFLLPWRVFATITINANRGGGQQSYNLAQNFAESSLDSANHTFFCHSEHCEESQKKSNRDSSLRASHSAQNDNFNAVSATSPQTTQILQNFCNLPKSLKFIAYFAFLILSFIAGMASEQMGILTIIALISLNYALFLRRRIYARFCDTKASENFTKPLIFLNFALLFFIAGWLALYLSPGHAKRASLAVFDGVYMSLGQILALDFRALIHRIAQTIMAFRSDILFFFSIPLLFLLCVREVSIKRVLIFALLVVLVLVLNNNLKFGSVKIFWLVHISAVFIILLALNVKGTRAESRKFYLGLFALFVAFYLCMLSTIQFPSLPHRARLGDSMIIIAMVAILFRRFAGLWVQILVVAICAMYAMFVAFSFLEYRISWEKMLASIEQSKQNGEKNIVVDNIFHSRYKNLMGWGNPGNNPNEWPNPTYAQYFGVESFRVK